MAGVSELAPTPKGRREAARIIQAATTVLARDGYTSATLRGVAAQAGIDKRMVVYYFKSREALMAQVVREVGRQVSARAEVAMAGLSEPDQVAGAGIDALWQASTEEPEMPRAYLALTAASTSSPQVADALADIKRELKSMFMRRVTALEDLGYRLKGNHDAYVTVMFAVLRGLIMEWSEDGDSAALDNAVEEFKHLAMSRFTQGPTTNHRAT